MRKARFTEHQIIAVIKSVEAGRTVKDVCREAGISEAAYYISAIVLPCYTLIIFFNLEYYILPQDLSQIPGLIFIDRAV